MMKSHEVGTGSETSPDAARLRTALADAIEGMEDMLPYVDKYFQVKWCHQDYIDRAKAALLAKPAEASEAEQIPTPHPVAEAEQSPQPAELLDGAATHSALRKLDQACQDLGRTALPFWDYNPPEYLRKEWEALADVLAEIGPLAQAPTRNPGKGE
jgi:hypothetical protein